MEFVGGGVKHDEENCAGGGSPVPGPGVGFDRFANGAPEQESQDDGEEQESLTDPSLLQTLLPLSPLG